MRLHMDSPSWPRSIAYSLPAVLVAVLVLAWLFPCPPWSLKVVVAQRAQCLANLKEISQCLQERRLAIDESHLDQIRGVLRELDLTCPEGTEIQGRPAGYSVEVENGSYLITEDPGNHPARSRFLAGAVDARQLAINAAGQVIELR